MKIAILAVLAAGLAGAASAEKVAVTIPANLDNPATAAAYTASLLKAVSRVCYQEAGPLIGVGYYNYLACVKATRSQVAAQEPTGLLAARLGQSSTVAVAAK